MTWFEKLTGFREETPGQVRRRLRVDSNRLTSLVNEQSWIWGSLQTPSLDELKEMVHAGSREHGRLSLREIVGDVQELHRDESNAGALFQVASQFNLLEMVSENMTPELGVGIYEHDPTQGPACAIAAGAGTIYRNYCVGVNGLVGQSTNNQIDCLADIGAALGNSGDRLWDMRNGYALASREGLAEISTRLGALNDLEMDHLRGKLRIGIQWDTQVTLSDCKHLVTQAYCSALPVSYSSHPVHLWAPFARLILEAAYEATICAAILNTRKSHNNRVFLTLLGGSAFGNKMEWIIGAIRHSLLLYKDADLDVAIVSYGVSNRHVRELVNLIKSSS